jgi:hypothetical protein
LAFSEGIVVYSDVIFLLYVMFPARATYYFDSFNLELNLPLGHDTCVEVLLEQEVFHKTEGNSFSPLHCAVINDNEGAAEMLIDTLGPAIVNATDTKNR